MISGRMFLVTEEERKKVEHSKLPPVTSIIYLLDSFYRPSIIYIITYILINNKEGFFKNTLGKIKGSLEIRHFDGVMPNYVWIIHKNNVEIKPKTKEKVKIR